MNMAATHDDFDIMDLPPAPEPEDYFTGCESPAAKAVELLRHFVWGLPESLRNLACLFEGPEIVDALLTLEGFSDHDIRHARRLINRTFPLDLESFRPQVDPYSWTPKYVAEALQQWVGRPVSVTAGRANKWCDWTVTVTLDGRDFTAYTKTRKAGLQQVVKRNDLAEHIARTDLARSGWKAPSESILRSYQTQAGRDRLARREALWEAARAEYQVKRAEVAEKRRETAQAYIDQSALMLSRLEGVNIRSLRDIKKALPEGWRAETMRDSRGICYFVYSGRFSWAASAYLATGAGEALVHTLRWPTKQTVDHYLAEMDNWRRHVPFGYPNWPQSPPATPQDVAMQG